MAVEPQGSHSLSPQSQSENARRSSYLTRLLKEDLPVSERNTLPFSPVHAPCPILTRLN